MFFVIEVIISAPVVLFSPQSHKLIALMLLRVESMPWFYVSFVKTECQNRQVIVSSLFTYPKRIPQHLSRFYFRRSQPLELFANSQTGIRQNKYLISQFSQKRKNLWQTFKTFAMTPMSAFVFATYKRVKHWAWLPWVINWAREIDICGPGFFFL